jgi:hypothetical protein
VRATDREGGRDLASEVFQLVVQPVVAYGSERVHIGDFVVQTLVTKCIGTLDQALSRSRALPI